MIYLYICLYYKIILKIIIKNLLLFYIEYNFIKIIKIFIIFLFKKNIFL